MSKCEKLRVRKEAMTLVDIIYGLTREYKELAKDYSLIDQIRRSSVSIVSNIAEWADSWSDNSYKQFLIYARECKTQVLIINRQYTINQETFQTIMTQIQAIHKMLNWLINALS